MKPRFIMASVVSIASISSASMLFLDNPSKSSAKAVVTQSSVEIKWGEGSEAGVPEAALTQNKAVHDSREEDTYVFAGKCANGEPYRLVSYQKDISGLRHSYYDYNGPVGTGSVESETDPKVMVVRICHKFAEIISANYWESR
jgi:hypothetical protein